MGRTAQAGLPLVVSFFLSKRTNGYPMSLSIDHILLQSRMWKLYTYVRFSHRYDITPTNSAFNGLTSVLHLVVSRSFVPR